MSPSPPCPKFLLILKNLPACAKNVINSTDFKSYLWCALRRFYLLLVLSKYGRRPHAYKGVDECHPTGNLRASSYNNIPLRKRHGRKPVGIYCLNFLSNPITTPWIFISPFLMIIGFISGLEGCNFI